MKNAYYNTASRTILQKIREAIGALMIENKYTKDEILQKYLSTVYMGNGLYGIRTVIGENPDNETILDTITRLKFPNITLSKSGNVMEYRNIINKKINLTTPGIHLSEKIQRNSIDKYPIITNRVDKEASLYC